MYDNIALCISMTYTLSSGQPSPPSRIRVATWCNAHHARSPLVSLSYSSMYGHWSITIIIINIIIISIIIPTTTTTTTTTTTIITISPSAGEPCVCRHHAASRALAGSVPSSVLSTSSDIGSHRPKVTSDQTTSDNNHLFKPLSSHLKVTPFPIYLYLSLSLYIYICIYAYIYIYIYIYVVSFCLLEYLCY